MKIVKIILVTFLIILYTSNGVFASSPEVSGKSAILMDGNSGRILYEKNIHEKLPMASTTKIMTAIVALEEGFLDDIIIVPPEAQGVEGSSIWLSAGEQHTLEDLLFGLMLRSGNDAATAIAHHISGDVEGFAGLMTQKAYDIGATQTKFMNPHGLHHTEHYTTAYDLGLITVHALKNPKFEEIVSTKHRTIPWEGHQWDRAMKNKNKLLWQYDGANGVKTGFTKKAGRCLVASAKRDGLQLVAVVLNCGPMFEVCSSMLDYGFEQYDNKIIIAAGELVSSLPIKGGKEKEIDFIASRSFSMALKQNEEKLINTSIELPLIANAPIEKGEQYGKISIYFDGELMDEVPIVAAQSVGKRSFWDIFRQMINLWR